MFDALGMAAADSYDFICTDDYTQKRARRGHCGLLRSWIDDRVDAEVPGIGEYTLYSILYIQPGALKRASP